MEIKINVGKIKTNKLKTLINEIEFKGKTRTEFKSYLDYTTGEYKEAKTDLTNLSGNIDPDVLIFLNAIKDKYPEINESNYKQVMTELSLFSDTYTYKVQDIRQTKEELIKERTERLKQMQEEEEQKAKDEAEIKASGNLTQSEKINLGTKEITKRIREQIKEKFPNCVFSVQCEFYSGGSSIHISLMKSNFKVIKDFEEIPQEAIDYYLRDGFNKIENLQKTQKENYHQLNNHFKEYDPIQWCNGVYLTEEGFNLFKRVMEIVNYYNYDNSDPMTDYFNVNFYTHLNIGKWNKPYIYEEGIKQEQKENKNNSFCDNVTIKKNDEKKGIEIYFNKKPSSDVLTTLKSNGFRWGKFNKCWYKKFYDGVEEEIKSLLGAC